MLPIGHAGSWRTADSSVRTQCKWSGVSAAAAVIIEQTGNSDEWQSRFLSLYQSTRRHIQGLLQDDLKLLKPTYYVMHHQFNILASEFYI
jgi:hypothetical protein